MLRFFSSDQFSRKTSVAITPSPTTLRERGLRLVRSYHVFVRSYHVYMAAILFPLLFCVHSYASASDYPSKPIRLIVGYAPGSGADVLARLVSPALQDRFGVPVVVDNKPGAGGVIAARETTQAAADGYTLLLGALPQMGIAPALTPDLSYDAKKDFAPIALVAGADMALITSPQHTPSDSLPEFIQWAQQQPSLFFGSSGPGTLGHFGSFIFSNAIGAEIQPVHFKSTGDQLTALFRGDVKAAFMPVAATASLVKAGRLRALLIAGPDRSPIFPDVVAATEAGFPDAQFPSWYGIIAPSGTPDEIQKKIFDVVKSAQNDAELKKRIEDAGLRLMESQPGEFVQFMNDEIDKWGELADRTGLSNLRN